MVDTNGHEGGYGLATPIVYSDLEQVAGGGDTAVPIPISIFAINRRSGEAECGGSVHVRLLVGQWLGFGLLVVGIIVDVGLEECRFDIGIVDGLAEEVLGRYRGGHGVARQIIGTVKSYADGVVGLTVIFDLEGLAFGVGRTAVAHSYLERNEIIPQHAPFGQRKLAVKCAKFVAGDGGGVDDVLARVANNDGGRYPCADVAQNGIVITAQDGFVVDGVAGLVKGTVGVDVGGECFTPLSARVIIPIRPTTDINDGVVVAVLGENGRRGAVGG